MEVDKKYLHQVRREIEAMALRIFCAKITGNPDGVAPLQLEASISSAISLRKQIDNEIKEKAVIPSTSGAGDIDNL